MYIDKVKLQRRNIISGVLSSLLLIFALIVVTGCDTSHIDFKYIVEKAKKQGLTYIRIPEGEYTVSNSTYLHQVKNLVIDGTNVKLKVITIGNLFFFDGCENVKIKGFTIDYDPLPYTQGTISTIESGKEVFFDIHKGYPDITEENLYESLYIFDKDTHLWKEGLGDVYGEMEVVNARRGYIKTKVEHSKLKVGDFVAVAKRRGAMFHSFGGSKNIAFEDLTILSAPSVVFSGRFAGSNHSFKRIKITKGPKPIGATIPRLLSANADAINYGISKSAPLVENSEFAFLGDDVINFHGPHFPIIKVENSTSFLTLRIQKFRAYKDVMAPGELLRHLSKTVYKILGSVKFKSIEEVKVHGFDKAFLKRNLPLYINKFCDIDQCTVYRIKIHSPLKMEVGESFDFPSANSSGFIIRDSYIHNNRGKVRIMSSDGLIEGNRFEQQRGTAINIGTEYPHWGEGGWSENIMIRNNTFKDIGIGNIFTLKNRAPAAISVYTMNSEGNHYIPGHSDIFIENNLIENSRPAAIYAYGVKNVVIKNNIIRNSFSDTSSIAGSARGVGPLGAVGIHSESIGTISNNIITSK